MMNATGTYYPERSATFVGGVRSAHWTEPRLRRRLQHRTMKLRTFTRLAILTVGCLTGCAKGAFHKVELFAEYPENSGQVPNYYRVTLSGKGRNGVVDYRSGWYDAKAVDALFGKISEEQEALAVTARRRKQAIRTTFDLYMDALEKGDPEEKLRGAQKRYQEALQSASGLTTLGSDPVTALDRADEKFIMILSSDPDQIIEAIKGSVQKSQIADAVVRQLDAHQRRQVAVTEQRLDQLLKRLNQAVDKLRASVASAESSDQAGVQALLAELISELEALQ